MELSGSTKGTPVMLVERFRGGLTGLGAVNLIRLILSPNAESPVVERVCMRSGKPFKGSAVVESPFIVVAGEEGLGGVFELEVRGEFRADMEKESSLRGGVGGHSKENPSECGTGGALNAVSTWGIALLELAR